MLNQFLYQDIENEVHWQCRFCKPLPGRTTIPAALLITIIASSSKSTSIGKSSGTRSLSEGTPKSIRQTWPLSTCVFACIFCWSLNVKEQSRSIRSTNDRDLDRFVCFSLREIYRVVVRGLLRQLQSINSSHCFLQSPNVRADLLTFELKDDVHDRSFKKIVFDTNTTLNSLLVRARPSAIGSARISKRLSSFIPVTILCS